MPVQTTQLNVVVTSVDEIPPHYSFAFDSEEVGRGRCYPSMRMLKQCGKLRIRVGDHLRIEHIVIETEMELDGHTVIADRIVNVAP